MYYDVKECGHRIRKLRKENQLKQLELAMELHVSENFLSLIELGKKSASIDMLVEIAERFHVSLDYLILGKDINKKQLKNMIQSLIALLTAVDNEL